MDMWDNSNRLSLVSPINDNTHVNENSTLLGMPNQSNAIINTTALLNILFTKVIMFLLSRAANSHTYSLLRFLVHFLLAELLIWMALYYFIVPNKLYKVSKMSTPHNLDLNLIMTHFYWLLKEIV